ncbi:barstar family protein [Corynebacterium tuberculostearicum]|uniref:barstar family protein n=1 Tax=Corynebacterium TaxID=1716 RepID=UPI001959536F|nr:MULTISPECIES: barstar family protein [Corynebacterium]MCG7461491.1 barstar family protein [Corynebacterium sp. ACRPF]MCG7465753.1 barstar family protein [Corynebacterium sp. ACRPJ]MDV2417702.1 barstar family protein [Corynebacterium tuberculostearicum]QRQ68149.1 barstar family protein [Corynebacterium tuberculostearicum]WKE52320.1 barstar family protein [Corynebacterium tuberculostearicum]
MQRILITEHIRTRADFFNALGRTRGCEDCGPRNLDDLADFLREQRTSVIIASDMKIADAELEGVATVLEDQGVKLVR